MDGAEVLTRRSILGLRSARGEALADSLMLIGAAGVFASLFLTWSHQVPASVRATPRGSPALRGVPRDPTAWQVYSIADVLLALLAAALLAVAVVGGSRRGRAAVLVAVGVALAFTVHAHSVAPTNGVLLVDGLAGVPQYVPRAATPGAGETVALAALGVAGAGLALSLPRP